MRRSIWAIEPSEMVRGSVGKDSSAKPDGMVVEKIRA
jgi:hypothetical protein